MLVSHGGQSNLRDVEMNANSDADSGAVDTTVEEGEGEGEGQRGIERQERRPQEE